MDRKAGNAEDTSGQFAGPVTFCYSQGSAVSSLAADGVGETRTIRIVIEEVALERAPPSLRATDLIRAERALKLTDAADPRGWTALDGESYANLYRAARMPRLLQAVKTLYDNVARHRLL